MDSLKNILSNKFQSKSVFSMQILAGLIVEFFNEKIQELWGQKIKSQAIAKSWKNGVVTVYSANPVIAQEIRMKSASLLRLTGAKFGADKVKKIKIVQSDFENDESLNGR